MEVIYVGSFNVEVDASEQDNVSQVLLDSFNCVATFLPPDLFDRYYNGFCKQQLWPLFHYMLPFAADDGGRFDRSLWEDYVSVNRRFAQRVIEVINPDEDYVWIHDYPLMVMPPFLRRRFNRLRMVFSFIVHFLLQRFTEPFQPRIDFHVPLSYILLIIGFLEVCIFARMI